MTDPTQAPDPLAVTSSDGNDEDERDDDTDPDYYPDGCNTCGGQGFIVVCIDDMCRGVGECMHGDGEIVCPDCKGEA